MLGRPPIRATTARASRLRDAPEGVVGERVVHAREHEVLPDQDAQLVAQVVERVLLVGADAGHAQHVHARVADGEDGRPQVVDRRREPDDVERGPQRAPGEDRHAVDVQGQAVALDVVVRGRPGGDLAEADAAGVDDRPGCRTVRSVDDEPDVVGRRVAVGVRPPALDRGHADGAVGGHARRRPGRPRSAARTVPVGPATSTSTARGAAVPPSATQTGTDGQDAVVAIERAAAASGRRRRRRAVAPARPGATARRRPARPRSPGIRPSSIVRNQRRLLSATRRVRQRARGLRWTRELRAPAHDSG